MSDFALGLVTAYPLVVLVIGALLLMVIDCYSKTAPRGFFTLGAAAFCVVSWVALIARSELQAVVFSGQVNADRFEVFLNSVILFGTLSTILLQDRMLVPQRVKETADVNVLILLAAVGAMSMVMASNLIVFFIGFETLSVAVYVMCGLARAEKSSAEGALKYFILGAFSSAFMLYGIVLLYASTGTLDNQAIVKAITLGHMANPIFLAGVALIVFGMAFKASLVPFHSWSPDAYQGSPLSITVFMAVVVKAAAIGGMYRFLHGAIPQVFLEYSKLLWVMAILTMTVGNLCALRQRSPKRMLAYSSIAHAGYLVMGFLLVSSQEGSGAVLFYLAAYSFMTIASFGVLLLVTAGTSLQYGSDDIESLRGLGWNRPVLGAVMAVALFSLAGMPPFAGFFGKFYLLSAAVKGGYVGLAVIAAINSLLSLAYYLRILVVMYFQDDKGDSKTSSTPIFPVIPLGPKVALGLATVGTILLPFVSDLLVGASSRSAQQVELREINQQR